MGYSFNYEGELIDWVSLFVMKRLGYSMDDIFVDGDYVIGYWDGKRIIIGYWDGCELEFSDEFMSLIED